MARFQPVILEISPKFFRQKPEMKTCQPLCCAVAECTRCQVRCKKQRVPFEGDSLRDLLTSTLNTFAHCGLDHFVQLL